MANKRQPENTETVGKENLLLQHLPPDEHERLSIYLERVRVDVNQTLAAIDNPLDYVYFPHDCVTSTLVETEEGSWLEVGLMGADGMVGLSLAMGERNSNSTVVVQIAGDATRMTASAFQKYVLEERGPLFWMIQRYCNAFMGMLAQSAVCNSLHPVNERICRWILMTHDRVKKDSIPLSRKFLAMMLGVRLPTVGTIAGTLKESGLIDYSKESITVLDRKGLEDSSCECYAIIAHQFRKLFDGDWRRR